MIYFEDIGLKQRHKQTHPVKKCLGLSSYRKRCIKNLQEVSLGLVFTLGMQIKKHDR